MIVASPSDDVQALIDQQKARGGGVIQLTPGVFSPFTIRSGVRVRGEGPEATRIAAPNNGTGAVVESEDFAALTGTNTWLDSAGVPSAFELTDLTIDGNRSNGADVYGLRFYGKRYTLNNVIVRDCEQDGVYSEGAYIGGQEGWRDLPEAYADRLWVRGCGGDGVRFLGPHDAHFGSLFACENTGAGLRIGWSQDLHNGTCDISFAHLYANDIGLYAESRLSVANLTVESNNKEGLKAVGGSVTAGTITAYNNWFSYSGSSAPAGNYSLSIDRRCAIGAIWVKRENGGSAIYKTSDSVVGAIVNIAADNTVTNATW